MCRRHLTSGLCSRFPDSIRSVFSPDGVLEPDKAPTSCLVSLSPAPRHASRPCPTRHFFFFFFMLPSRWRDQAVGPTEVPHVLDWSSCFLAVSFCWFLDSHNSRAPDVNSCPSPSSSLLFLAVLSHRCFASGYLISHVDITDKAEWERLSQVEVSLLSRDLAQLWWGFCHLVPHQCHSIGLSLWGRACWFPFLLL